MILYSKCTTISKFYSKYINKTEIKLFYIKNSNSICDPVIGNELGERILSPESEKRRDLLIQFLDEQRFDLMLTFTAGNSELR